MREEGYERDESVARKENGTDEVMRDVVGSLPAPYTSLLARSVSRSLRSLFPFLTRSEVSGAVREGNECSGKGMGRERKVSE